jgi:large repetitive protein
VLKRHLRFIPLTLALLAASSAHAESQLDIHKAMNAAPTANAGRRIQTSLGTVASVDEKRGVPTFLWVAPPPAASLSSRVMTRSPEEIAREFIAQNLDLYSLSSPAVDAARVREVHDTGSGGIIVIFAQTVDGIDVWRNEMKVLLDRQGDVIAVGGNLHADAIPVAQGGPRRVFTKTDTQALVNAFDDRTGVRLLAADFADTGREEYGYRYFDLVETATTKTKGIVLATQARAKKILYAMPDRLVPAYYLELDLSKAGSSSGDLWGYVVSAETGELLERDHLTQDAAFTYRVYADTAAPFTPLDGPIADWTPHPSGVPNGSSPPFISPVPITIDGFNTNPGGTFDPWLVAGATTTTGNNVDAYADIVANDGFNNGDLRPTAMGTSFNFTYDTSSAPGTTAQRNASVTSLFFMNNWLHDYFYDSGFNEAAGNAQANNFGRGGAQNDRLLAEAQDYSGTDNANMSTPADGQSPRMQMYVFTGASVSLVEAQPLNALYTPGTAAFGPTTFNITFDGVVAEDGTGPDVNDICEAVTNNVMGKIAIINRGTCTFESKAFRAQQAGAAGVILVNNAAGGAPGMAEDAAFNATIPTLSLSQDDGNALKAAIAMQAQQVTLRRDPPKVDRDGTLDNQIVAHEWGHYIHRRLVPTCTTLNCGTFGCGQCGGQGEGWGDFVAMHMTLRPGDNMTSGTYAAAIYASDAFGDAAYFGIRRYPYSRDFTKNGLTFRHITAGQTLPPLVPSNSTAPDNNQVHNTGEVWASMLFEAYTELQLFGGHTFDEAKRRMADYIVAGMKLAPANPTFTQQRDGILAAARAADLMDAMYLADGFARRGAGTCAVSPAATSTTHAGVVEDFDNVGVMQITGTVLSEVPGCDNDGVVDTGETGTVDVSVFNSGIGYLLNTSVSVTSGTASVTFPSGNSAVIPSIAPGATGIAKVPVALVAGTTAIVDADFAITANNATACTTTTSATASGRMNYDKVLSSSATEEFEASPSNWVEWGAVGYETLATTLWAPRRQVVNDYWYNGANHTAVSDTALESPPIIAGAGNLTISFVHAFDLDYLTGPPRYYDGGVVEVSNNNGMTWTDVANLGAVPGYTGALLTGTGNPIAGRQAYSRRNAAWPNTNTVTLNLGNQFAGQTIKIRFRIGTDNQVRTPGTQGWFIDTVTVTGATNTPFDTIVQDPIGCSNNLCANVTCNDNNACTTDTCNPATGMCEFMAMANGSACNDGSACTTGETCNAGTCGGGMAVTCDDNNSCTTDSCNAATGCVFTNATNGTACNDNNACTQTDTCQAGTCTGANPVTCAASDQCHVAGTCDPMTGACSNPNAPNGTVCNDNSACTTADVCTAGTCGGTAVTCNDNNSCTSDSCNAATGCVFAPAGNGTACNDGSACTTGETCNAGTCGGGMAVTCNDNNSCTNDSCNAATGCVFAPAGNGTACNDGNACTQADSCQNGTCTGANPVTCVASDQCHVAGTCNPATGACDNPNAPDNTACNDNSACTQTDTCQAGVCTGANPVTCTASDQCHDIGTCDPMTGMCSNPNLADGSNCNDGNLCTVMDKCTGGSCAGTLITCNTPGVCQDPGSCDPALGICQYPNKPDGTVCPNGTCQAGSCMTGAGGAGGTGGAGGMAGAGGAGGMAGAGGAGGTGGAGGMAGAGGTSSSSSSGGGMGGTAGEGGRAGGGGTGGAVVEGGCDCASTTSNGAPAGSGLLLGLGLLAARLRRRRNSAANG